LDKHNEDKNQKDYRKLNGHLVNRATKP